MPKHDATTATCRVLTFKDGLLSAVAHDLEIGVETFEVEFDEGMTKISALFDARSMCVRHAMVDGRPSTGALSAKDKAKIEANIAKDVLRTKRHPEIRFTSAEITHGDSGWTVRGRLELAGETKELTVRIEREGEKAVSRTTIHQPDFRIKPYTAMLGTLKIKPDVEVELSVPLTR